MPTARSSSAAAPSGLGKAIALRTDLVKIRPDSDAAQASHAIGATMGFSIIFTLWIFGADLLDAFCAGYARRQGNRREASSASTLATTDDASAAQQADEVVARYLKAQQTQSRCTSPESMTTFRQPSFGRRRWAHNTEGDAGNTDWRRALFSGCSPRQEISRERRSE
jgi:hypothetical protein